MTRYCVTVWQDAETAPSFRPGSKARRSEPGSLRGAWRKPISLQELTKQVDLLRLDERCCSW